MRRKAGPIGVLRASLRIIASIIAALIPFFSVIPGSTQASVTTSITPTTGAGSLGTTVTQTANLYDITGGTRAGTNLFHSFGNFNVGTGDIANFLNTPVNGSLPSTSNILGSVTGGNISNIFGTIQTTNFPGADLFLINPAGFLFGPNATVNVGGVVTFTSADYMRLADGGHFNANADAALGNILTTAPLAAFGFLGSKPGAIIVQGSQLTITPGQSISLVGGNITVEPGVLDNGTTIQAARVSVPEGQISLVSVASPGEVFYPNLQTGPNINGQSFGNMGNIKLSQGSMLDVSAHATGEAAGTITILGGQLLITDATISADTVNANGAPIAVDINVTGDLSITDTRGVPAITARTTGTGNAGEVQITSSNLTAKSSFVDPSFLPTTLIDTSTTGMGRAGNVSITRGNISVSGEPGAQFAFIDSGTRRSGHGGNVTITSTNLALDWTIISTGDLVARLLNLEPSGSAGNLTINADSLKASNFAFSTESFAAFSATQVGGDLILNVHDIHMLNGAIGSSGVAHGGSMTINADTFHTDFTSLGTNTEFESGGNITVTAHAIELTNGSALVSSTFGDGEAGDIRITATDHVSLLGDVGTNPLAQLQPSGLFSNSLGFVGTQGNAGNIFVTTPRLDMVGGRINTTTQTSGSGGDIKLNVRDSISISGEFLTDAAIVPSIFDIGPLAPSGVVTSTIGGACSGLCGNAGHISLTTGSLSLQNGGRIDSGTSSTGRGGDVAVSAVNTISLSGTLTDGTPVGVFSRSIGNEPDSGSGGNIDLTAGQSFTISNGASVSASSTGAGNAGNIKINAGQQLDMRDSSIKTEAAQASGGNIDIQAVDRVRLVNSIISTSVLGGSGNGGNISIDPNVVVLQNSQVIAQAVQGAGGNITITTPLFLADQTSLVNASSQFGLNGTVTIQNPTSNLSQSLGPLPSSMQEQQALQAQRCAALHGGASSSFIIGGRDTVPTEPGGWLASSLGLHSLGGGILADTMIDEQPPTTLVMTEASESISLRRLTPIGFLTQRFAGNGSDGCRS